jgi:Protein of unknown function (DUF1573)
MKLTLTMLMTIIIVAGPTGAIAAPEISVDRPVYDFGSISQGKKVEHVFIIRNKGNTPLNIKSVRPSCGCTAITSSASVIAPGKSGEIKTSFNSANYSGAVNKTVTVDSNDPKVPSSILNLKGTVIEEIQITPKQLNLGQVKIDATKKATVTVSNRGSKPLKLTAVKSTLPQIAPAAEKKLIKPGESVPILISVTPRKGDRLLSGYISILTDNPAKPEITVPVYGSPVN